MVKICGIYKITNLVNGKVYIGSSIDIKRRWKKEHLYFLEKNKHWNDHLQSSWNKYGKKNFKFEIEEPCSEELLIEREDYNINKYDSMNPDKGYNNISADRQIISEKTRQKMSNSLKGKHLSPKTEFKSGEKHYLYGKHLPENTKQKISEIRKGESNPACKLTENKVWEIRFWYDSKISKKYGLQRQLAKEYNVTFQNINRIVNYKSWKNNV